MKNFSICLLSILFPALLSAQVAADLPINPNATFNGEQSLAIDPTDANHLVVAWMKYHAFPAPAGMVIAVSTSTDGGSNWTTPLEIPHIRAHWVSADPSLVFKNDGSLYLAYIDYKNSLDSGGVYVRKSTNGGANWGSANKVIDYYDNADLAIDRPWIAVDNSGGTYDGNLYVVTKSIKTDVPPHHIYMMRSLNGGVNWSTALLVDNGISSGSLTSMGVPAVTSSGKLVIAYAFWNPPALPGYAIATSTNGGFSLANSLVGTYSTQPTTNDTLLQGSYNLSAYNSSLVLVSTRKTAGDFDIWAMNSNDHGATWSAAQRICHDPLGNGNNQDMVWANFSNTGKYAAVWRDRRANNGAQNQPYKIWGTFSLDGGANFFGADLQISQTDGPLMIPVDGNDFLGCALSDSIIYSTWTDKRNNTSNQLFINKSKFSTLTGLKENASHSKNVIYPNPNNGTFILKFENATEKKIEIFDLAGKLIYLGKTTNTSLDVKLNAPKGIYSVKISEDKTVSSLKLVVE